MLPKKLSLLRQIARKSTWLDAYIIYGIMQNLQEEIERMIDNFTQDEKPTVQYFAEKLSVSLHYLNDMLKNCKGQSTQQHIQNKLIEKAKELLSTTNLSVSGIAYPFGFESPQSFHKLFKNKTEMLPLESR